MIIVGGYCLRVFYLEFVGVKKKNIDIINWLEVLDKMVECFKKWFFV